MNPSERLKVLGRQIRGWLPAPLCPPESRAPVASIRRYLEYILLGLIFAASSYEAAISSAPVIRWSSLSMAAVAAAFVAGLHWAHLHNQEYPEWMKPGFRRQLYFVVFVIASSAISSFAYYMANPQQFLEIVTSEVLVMLFTAAFAWGSLSAYRKEKRRVAELGENAGPAPFYPVFPYSWGKYIFISLMSVTGGLALMYVMSLANSLYPTNPSVAFVLNSNSILVAVPYLPAIAIGGLAGYVISKSRWFTEGMFVWIVAWGFWLGSLFSYMAVQQATSFQSTPPLALSVSAASVAAGIVTGYALTRTEWYVGWKTQFLFNNGVLGAGDSANMQTLMSTESAAHRALRTLSPTEEVELYQALESKRISELTDLEFAERLELAESLPGNRRKAE